MNHSCVPNISLTWLPEAGIEVLHAITDIDAGACERDLEGLQDDLLLAEAAAPAETAAAGSGCSFYQLVDIMMDIKGLVFLKPEPLAQSESPKGLSH